MDPRLRGDDNVKVDLITIDAGWTKLKLVLPVVKRFLKKNGIIIALLKPQHEADKHQLKKGVLSPEIAEQVKKQVMAKIQNLEFRIQNEMESPILGGGESGIPAFNFLTGGLFTKKFELYFARAIFSPFGRVRNYF